MNKIYKPTLPHLVRTYTTWPFRASYTSTLNMVTNRHPLAVTDSDVHLLARAWLSSSLARTPWPGHGQLDTLLNINKFRIFFFYGHADFPNRNFFNLDAILHIHCIYILINIVWMCSAILNGYIYVYNYIYMIVY